VRDFCSNKPVANERFVSMSNITGPLDFERGTQDRYHHLGIHRRRTCFLAAPHTYIYIFLNIFVSKFEFTFICI
jgi:hypothetical protein